MKVTFSSNGVSNKASEVLRAAMGLGGGRGGIDQYEQIITGASVPACKECDIAEVGDGREEINGLLFVDP